MALNSKDFQAELDRVFTEAEHQGKASVQVNSGQLHRRLGEYPGPNHRMATLCTIMHQNYRPEVDVLVLSPPKGKGASLTIRYQVPRG